MKTLNGKHSFMDDGFAKRYRDRVTVPDILYTHPRLQGNVILLGLGGSLAYGTDTAASDVDLRGIATNPREEILLGKDFEQVADSRTDTVIYSFKKITGLLADSNPNVLELLFLDEDQYLYMTPIGRQLIEKRDMFLSQIAYYKFGGYARAQLGKLKTKSQKLAETDVEERILNSIRNAQASFPGKYFQYPEDAIRLHIGDVGNGPEILMDLNLRDYPLRDYKCMWSEMHSVVKDYASIGKRAKSAVRRGVVEKHAMQLIRLELLTIQLLETGTMRTHMVNDHDLLMDIRNGAFSTETGMNDEFFKMEEELSRRVEAAKEHSVLPKKPDYKAIEDFVCRVNMEMITGT